MTQQLKLDHHHRTTAERAFRHPTSHNIQWHDVQSLLGTLGACRETTHHSYEVKVDDLLVIFRGPLGRDLTDEHVGELRKVLRRVGITPENLGAA
jgi:hypothetical protein